MGVNVKMVKPVAWFLADTDVVHTQTLCAVQTKNTAVLVVTHATPLEALVPRRIFVGGDLTSEAILCVT